LALVDVLLVHASFGVAFLVRFNGDPHSVNLYDYFNIVPWISLASLIIFTTLDLYKRQWNGVVNTIRSLSVGLILLFFVTAGLAFLWRGFAFPRSVLILGFLVQIILMSIWRVVAWRFEKGLCGVYDVLVIAPDEEANEISKIINDHSHGWLHIITTLTLDQLETFPGALRNADLVLLGRGLTSAQRTEVMLASIDLGKGCFLLPEFDDLLVRSAELTQINDLAIMALSDLRLTVGQEIMKRGLDILLSIAVLLLALPIMAVVSLAIRCTSPGRVFYIQERVGREGKAFNLLKFRSMVNNAESLTGPVLAMDSDPRITRVGRFIRATRIDELPQLINVLKGDMSFVGPRPERPVFVEQFLHDIPGYKYRHLVKPGITGMAQVAGNYDTTAEEKLRYDLWYITNYAIFLDLKILLQTIPVVLQREKSQGCSNSRLKKVLVRSEGEKAGVVKICD